MSDVTPWTSRQLQMAIFRYGYNENEAIEKLNNAAALSSTGLNSIETALEMLHRLEENEMVFDTREAGWHPI